MSKEIKTFQENNKVMYIFLAFSGMYIPELHLLIPSAFIRRCFRLCSVLPILLGCLNLLQALSIIAIKNFSAAMLLALFRKHTTYLFCYSKIIICNLYATRITAIFNTWNEERCCDHYARKRQKIFASKMKLLSGYYAALFVNFMIIPQVYSFRIIIDPYAEWTKAMWVPHELSDPLHLFYSILTIIMLFFINMGTLGFFTICFQLLTMLSAEVQCLKESLKEIVSSLPIDENGEVALENIADSDLYYSEATKDWIATHIRAMKFVQQVIDFLSLESAVKYIYTGLNLALVGITSIHMIKANQSSDASIIVLFALGNCGIQYTSTRLAHDLQFQSMNLFDEAYNQQWFSHSMEVKKMLHIISIRCSQKPIQLRFMRCFVDNAPTFLSMLSMAYKAYSVLLSSE